MQKQMVMLTRCHALFIDWSLHSLELACDVVSNSIAHCILWRCVAITRVKQVVPPRMLPHEGRFHNLPFPVLIILDQDLFTPCKLHMCTPPLEQLSINTNHLPQELPIRTALTLKFKNLLLGMCNSTEYCRQAFSVSSSVQAYIKVCRHLVKLTHMQQELMLSILELRQRVSQSIWTCYFI